MHGSIFILFYFIWFSFYRKEFSLCVYLLSIAAITNCQKLRQIYYLTLCRSEVPVDKAVPLLQVSQVSQPRLGGSSATKVIQLLQNSVAGRYRAEVPFLAGCQPGASPRCLHLGFLVYVLHIQASQSTVSPFPSSNRLALPFCCVCPTSMQTKFSAFNGLCN